MARKLPEVVGDKEFTQIVRATYKDKHKLAFMLAYLCGLRVSEVTKLKPDDVDRSRGMLFIRQAKGSKDRYVPYPRKLSARLSVLPVGCTPRSLQIAFKRAVERAKIKKDLHFHCLRHSCATNYLKKGMNLKSVQQLLGHSNISVTSIYLHVSPDEVKAEMDAIFQ